MPVGTSVDLAVVDASLALPTCRPRGRRGRVAAAAHDEDVVTLGATALIDLLDGTSQRPTALLLATTSSPLAEGGVVQEMAAIAGLAGPACHVAEHSGTVAAGLAVLLHAIGTLTATSGPVAVVLADDRHDERGRPLGAGALALLLDRPSNTGGADAVGGGSLRWLGSAADVVRDQWRAPEESGVRDGDRALASLGPDVGADGGADGGGHRRGDAVGDTTAAVCRVVHSGPRGPRLDRAGTLGCAAPLTAALVASCDVAVGATIRMVSTAGGVQHVVDLHVEEGTAALGQRLQSALDGGVDAAPTAAAETSGFAPFVSGPRAWRERGQDLRLDAQRDLSTGEVVFPPPPTAAAAGLAETQLSRVGTVLTMTTDRVFPYGGPIQMAVVALDDGGRFYGQVVPEAGPLHIDDRVRLVPRNLYTVDGLAQRYWKVAPMAPHGTD